MTKGVKQKHNEQITTIEVSASVFHSWTKSDYSCCNQHWGRYQGSGNTLAYEPRCAAAQSSCTHCAASATRSIGLHLAKLRPGRTRRKHRGRLRDEEEISVSMQPTHQHHPSSCADSSQFCSRQGKYKDGVEAWACGRRRGAGRGGATTTPTAASPPLSTDMQSTTTNSRRHLQS